MILLIKKLLDISKPIILMLRTEDERVVSDAVLYECEDKRVVVDRGFVIARRERSDEIEEVRVNIIRSGEEHVGYEVIYSHELHYYDVLDKKYVDEYEELMWVVSKIPLKVKVSYDSGKSVEYESIVNSELCECLRKLIEEKFKKHSSLISQW